MMLKIRKIYILLIVTIIYSCRNNNTNLCLNHIIEDYPNYDAYVIIPTSLCKSCNATYNTNLISAYKSDRICLVFNCENSDTLLLNYHLNQLNLSKTHIVIDTLKQYTICDSISESIYPAILYVIDKEINEIKYYNFKNPNAYETLEKRMRKIR